MSWFLTALNAFRKSSKPPIVQNDEEIKISRFPFAHLPLIPKREILGFLSPTEIFLFSLTSKTIANLRLPKPSGYYHAEWQVFRYSAFVTVTDENARKTFCFEFRTLNKNKNQSNRCSMTYQSLVLAGQTMLYKIKKEDGVDTLEVCAFDPGYVLDENIWKVLITRFFNYFRVCELSLSIRGQSMQVLKHFPIEHLKCRNILLGTPIPSQKMNSDEFIRVLESSVTSLTFYWKVDFDFQYQKGLKIPILCLDNADWLTPECLFDMECESLNVENCILTLEDINKFLGFWMEGRYRKLKSLVLYSKEYKDYLDVIMKGIGSKPMCTTHGCSTCDADRVRKIQRADGKIGVVQAFLHAFHFHIQ